MCVCVYTHVCMCMCVCTCVYMCAVSVSFPPPAWRGPHRLLSERKPIVSIWKYLTVRRINASISFCIPSAQEGCLRQLHRVYHGRLNPKEEISTRKFSYYSHRMSSEIWIQQNMMKSSARIYLNLSFLPCGSFNVVLCILLGGITRCFLVCSHIYIHTGTFKATGTLELSSTLCDAHNYQLLWHTRLSAAHRHWHMLFALHGDLCSSLVIECDPLPGHSLSTAFSSRPSEVFWGGLHAAQKLH